MTPQSVRFCRPKELSFEKETDEAIRKKFDELTYEISNLKDYVFVFNGIDVTIHYTVYTTMFDGKCVNAIMNNKSTITCPLCFFTSSQFNQDPSIFKASEKGISLGISLLHCVIKAFEHFLHMAYRIPVQKWICRGIDKGNCNKFIVLIKTSRYFKHKNVCIMSITY